MPVSESSVLLRTPLYSLHLSLGARMVPFAGYEMPVQYPKGIIAEHLHTRTQAGLFDVSHMGQLRLGGADPAAALETLVPGDIRGLGPSRMRYTLLLGDKGGIRDDLIVTRHGDGLFVVVNAATKGADLAYLRERLGGNVTIERFDDRALLALQGPAAAAVLERLAPRISQLPFMTAAEAMLDDRRCLVTRSGYTGEDGFEISLAGGDAPWLAERLLAETEVAPAGLGARDSLRLEAGLCLYGHDIDETTTPVEAALAWTIPKRRREAGGFPGAGVILQQLAAGPSRRRVGIRSDSRAPAREGTPILDLGGSRIGQVTSGGFSPSLGAPIAMGYVASGHAAVGTALGLEIRGAVRPGRVVALPFVAHRYRRSGPGSPRPGGGATSQEENHR